MASAFVLGLQRPVWHPERSAQHHPWLIQLALRRQLACAIYRWRLTGAALAGGCNVGGMYNAIGNLSASGFAMWVGLVPGAIFGLWLLYKEMEHITWGGGGSKTFEIPFIAQVIVGIAGLIGLIWLANYYSNFYCDASFTADGFCLRYDGAIYGANSF